MKSMRKLISMAALLVAAWGIMGCGSDVDYDEFQEITQPDTGRVWQQCRLELDLEVEPFDGRSTRSAGWQDADEVYLVFSGTEESVEGKAVYDATEGTWTLHYYGTLSNTTSSSCKAYYFDGAYTLNSAETAVTLTPNVAVYADASATYTKSGRDIKVKTTLKPQTGRIRFKGAAGTQFTVSGISTYATYTLASGAFANSSTDISLTVGQDGYTPYVYGVMSSSARKMTVSYSDELAYRTTCEDYVLSTGKSGFMELPTQEAHNGWKTILSKETFSVNGVSFTMVYVEGGTFSMGATSEQGSDYQSNEKPIHSVTLSDYYIGETEVTQELWQAVMGTNPSNFTGNLELPVEYVSWNDCQTFISALNNLTGRTFALPTEAQWEYAARGGRKSQGYKYSGSNTIGDVAWYSGNASSKTHAVKSKQPNELGLYDMSGNVWEWCSDWYASYSSAAATDPTGPSSGSYRVLRGGSWRDCATLCRVSGRYYDSPSYAYSNSGLRLVLR